MRGLIVQLLTKDTLVSIGGGLMGEALSFHAVVTVACMGMENLVLSGCRKLVLIERPTQRVTEKRRSRELWGARAPLSLNPMF